MWNVWNSKVVPVDNPEYVSGGWQQYNQIEAVGNVAGTSAPDVVSRDASGVLWLHQGTGEEPKALANRLRIGPGWQVYTELTGGSDLDGDGRADLVATDKRGDLWFYKGTGSATEPFAPRRKTGFGWGVYNHLTATGNIAGAAAGDLIARDKDGVLWLYLGNGDGTFAQRIKVGGGWNGYTDIVAIGDANKDGRPDLYATHGPNRTAYFYAGMGNWRTPFANRWSTGLLVGNPYGIVFDRVS
ncbi:FG-GAP repeat domain-containing protein [Streptomyces sp. NPDC006477]|uniref:FG-GAP repeat domain-containing protein n=1 Tax=Streptomyces sp. NPDC006477 TaxID=3364747 RepID=UPI0036CF26A6